MHVATVQMYSGKKLARIREEYPLLKHVPIPSANSFYEVGKIAIGYANTIGFKGRNLIAYNVKNIEVDEKDEVYTVTLDVTEV